MSEDPDRRTFLKGSALAVSGLAAGCRPDRGGNARNAGAGPAPHLLRAVAEVVLPSELGDEGRERVAAGFETWLREYEPVPELLHGYGSQEIRYGPPDPVPRWTSQLEALDLEARRRHGAGFAELDLAERRALVERALSGTSATLPDRAGALEADHVAVGLLGYFFGSPEATDLCYGRRIGGLGCRPLGASPERPPELAGGAPEAAAGRAARVAVVSPFRALGRALPIQPPDPAS